MASLSQADDVAEFMRGCPTARMIKANVRRAKAPKNRGPSRVIHTRDVAAMAEKLATQSFTVVRKAFAKAHTDS